MLHWALFVSERTNKSIIIIHSHHAPQATSRGLDRKLNCYYYIRPAS
jgi:hypothetical protein